MSSARGRPQCDSPRVSNDGRPRDRCEGDMDLGLDWFTVFAICSFVAAMILIDMSKDRRD